MLGFVPEVVEDCRTGFDGGIGLDKQTHLKSGFQISLTQSRCFRAT